MELLPYVISTAATCRRVAIDPDCRDDPYNRYIMHQLVVDLQSKRAHLVNLVLIAKELQTTPDYIATYLASSLNTGVKRIKGAASTSWALYPAAFSLEKMDACFRDFLSSYILCPSCSLPELVYLVKESSSPSSSPPRAGTQPQPGPQQPSKRKGSGGAAAEVRQVCQACGRGDASLARSLKRVKNTKFVDYVLAHPPQQTSSILFSFLPHTSES